MLPTTLQALLLVWLGLNAVVACVYGYDKWQAKRGGRRVRERTLLWLAFLGGAAGALLGMQVSRHKTRKAAFRYGVPLCLLLQAGGAVGTWLSLR
ncbi:MAG: DUF1294 domain-containing protein [Myxococcales bacterium]|nr:DUF1294 domain-containing protein [Myxococcales bacterium]